MEEKPEAEKELVQDEQTIEKAVSGDVSDGRGIMVVVLVIAGIFVLLFGGFYTYNKLTGAGITTIDGLHQQNLEGELDKEEGYMYNGYSVVYADGLWWTELNKFGTRLKVPLHFGPKELEDVVIEGELDPGFNQGDKVFVAIDPKVQNKYYTLAISELSFNLVKGMDRESIGSCTEEHWACENRTLVSCTNNSLGLPVVELALEEGPGIELSGSCIKVKGNNEYDIVKSADRLLYQWYGVMG